MILGKKEKTVAGLDIGTSCIKLVKFEEKAGAYILRSMGIREISTDVVVDEEIKDRDALIYNIQSLIDQCDPHIKEVAIAVAGHGVLNDKIVMDKKTGTEAEQAILFEAEQRSPFDVDDVSLDYHVIKVNEETSKMDVLLVAAREDFLKSYLDLILDCGLKPVLVDTEALALLNAYEINYEINPEKVTALVNIGFDTTNLTFIKDGIYNSARDISSGMRTIYESIMKEFRLNPEFAIKTLKGEMGTSIDQDMLKSTVVTASEELISGLEVALSYFKSSTKVSNLDWIVISGGGALIPFLPEFIQSKINIPVEIINPLRNIEYDPDIFREVQPEKIAPLLTIAVGLAARKVK
jgi:type IV pilus assembly protein PilM